MELRRLACVMALHQNKHLERLGLPEFLGLAILACAAVGITLWWQDRDERPGYLQTDGHVVEGRVSLVHYNATALSSKVSVTYSYSVGERSYTGSWVGFWPDDNSPNAASQDRLNEVCAKGHPLIVFYDPDNPSENYIHPAERGNQILLQGFALATCALALVYWSALYPAWR